MFGDTNTPRERRNEPKTVSPGSPSAAISLLSLWPRRSPSENATYLAPTLIELLILVSKDDLY